MKDVRGEAVWTNWNPPAALFPVSLSRCFSTFSSPGPGLELPSPSSSLLVIPLVRVWELLNFPKIHI